MKNESESFDDLARQTRDSFQAGKYMAESAREGLASVIPPEVKEVPPRKEATMSHSEYLLGELEMARAQKDDARIAQVESFIKIIEDNNQK